MSAACCCGANWPVGHLTAGWGPIRYHVGRSFRIEVDGDAHGVCAISPGRHRRVTGAMKTREPFGQTGEDLPANGCHLRQRGARRLELNSVLVASARQDSLRSMSRVV